MPDKASKRAWISELDFSPKTKPRSKSHPVNPSELDETMGTSERMRSRSGSIFLGHSTGCDTANSTRDPMTIRRGYLVGAMADADAITTSTEKYVPTPLGTRIQPSAIMPCKFAPVHSRPSLPCFRALAVTRRSHSSPPCPHADFVWDGLSFSWSFSCPRSLAAVLMTGRSRRARRRC